mgnify:CR=1 FL=1
MKNSLLVLSAATITLLYSCGDKKSGGKATEAENFTTLEGKIKIGTDEKESVYYLTDPLDISGDIRKKIFLKKDGSFKDTIQNIKPGNYILTNGDGKTINLYLKNGQSIKITTNATTEKLFMDSLSVKGSVENQFLADYDKFKYKNIGEDAETIFKADEKVFKAKLDSLKSKSENFINTYKGLPDAFKKETLTDLTYGVAALLENYPSTHAQITQNAQYKVSDAYYDFTKTLTVNDEKLFKSNAKYRNYAVLEIQRQLFKDLKPKQGENTLDLIINKLKQAKYPAYINDYFLLQISAQGLQSVPPYEQYEQMWAQRINQQVQMFKQKNPNAQVPPLPTKDEIKARYDQESAMIVKNNEEVYGKISANMSSPDLKKILEETYTVIKGLKKGDVAPVIDVLDKDKEMDVVKEFKGKTIVVCFWNYASIEQSKEDLPAFEKLATEFKDKEVVFVSINMDLANKADKWNEDLKKSKFEGKSYRAYNDFNSKFIKMYGVVNRPLPRFVIIDKDGKIANYDAPTATDIALKNEITSILNVK